MLDLQPIKARLAAATPGPWECSREHPDLAGDHIVLEPMFDVRRIASVSKWVNTLLITHAPSDLAALVAEVERLQALVEKLQRSAGSPQEQAGTFIGILDDHKIFVAPKSTETELSWDSAVRHCTGLEVENTAGWRLPTKEELHFLYCNQSSLPDAEAFIQGRYWSGSEAEDECNAWGESFTHGKQYAFHKSISFCVRAIRKESIDA